MGKYERGDIELLEKSVALVLAGKSPLINKGHKWYRHMIAFVHYIRSMHPDCEGAEYVGNRYGGQNGDIKLLLPAGKIVPIELKASETATGKNTLANIGQNALTTFDLLQSRKTPILSWSEFREKEGFKAKIKNLLDSYRYNKVHQIRSRQKLVWISEPFSFESKAQILKELAYNGNKKATLIKLQIMDLARQNKIDYINYIKEFTPNIPNIKKFIFCMLTGVHKQESISDILKKELPRPSKLITLYANSNKRGISISKEVNKLSQYVHDPKVSYKISFQTKKDVVTTYFVVYDSSDPAGKRILSFVYHWKNVFQGIKTPCINVFLGPDY